MGSITKMIRHVLRRRCRVMFGHELQSSLLSGHGSSHRRALFSKQPECRHAYSTNNRSIVLGIETSCDDTAVGIVDDEGSILGESAHSQLAKHIEYGGIIPPIARDMHAENIAQVAQDALKQCPVPLEAMTAIAVTTRPGMALSLRVGFDFACNLARKYGKPLVPVHHMEAHATAVRLQNKVEFPYLVLLVSGGHCQLAVVRAIDDFLLLGQTIDDAPGEALDKVARRLKVHNLPECSRLSGGAAIELLARGANPHAFPFPEPMMDYRSCDFSFAGLKNSVYREILRLEKQHGIEADALVPEVRDVCASAQRVVVQHLVRRTQRALEFCSRQGLLPPLASDELRQDRVAPTVVVAGGVACNGVLRDALAQLCDHLGARFVATPARLCSDNGLMIAWNGLELHAASPESAVEDLGSLRVEPRCPLGTDISQSVAKASIKLQKIKLKFD
ncbi:threonyl-carbamoyl synthesis 4 [Dermacentor variabilis]|uniref:threonyl-carbamoyl synthesis 4 n=1 Tax=Dermacentor variabilis TaxID=34621 RepID=UPI003F5B74C4